MGVQDDLEALRARISGCTVVAFADLDTRIVLVSSSASEPRRETLDGLCAGAIALFSTADSAGETDADMVMRSRDDNIEVSLRDPERRDDALCAICSPDTDIDAFLAAARDVLQRMSQEGGA